MTASRRVMRIAMSFIVLGALTFAAGCNTVTEEQLARERIDDDSQMTPERLEELTAAYNKCGGVVANGSTYYCRDVATPTVTCLCTTGEGNCNHDYECGTGTNPVTMLSEQTYCRANQGQSRYGFAAGTGVCLPTRCYDGVINFGETAKDCGGTSGCGICTPSCTDLVQNGSETGVDCGGTCPACTFANRSGAGTVGGKSGANAGGQAEGRGIGVDSSGNVYIAGFFTGTVNFGGGTITSGGGMTATGRSAFVVKYNSSGVFQWARYIGKSGSNDCNAYAMRLAVDSAGNSVVTGYYDGELHAGSLQVTSGSSGASQDIYVMRIDSSGTPVWLNSYGDATGSQQAYAVTIDRSGGQTLATTASIYVVGDYRGSMTFGATTLTTCPNDWCSFIAKLDRNGNPLWARGAGNGATAGVWVRARGVVVDNGANVAYVGQFRGTANFGNGNLVSAGGDDVFVARYTSAGAVQYTRRGGNAAGDQRARNASVNGSNELQVAGYYTGSFQMSSANAGCPSITSSGGWDSFVISISTGGVCIMSKSFGASGDQLIDASATASNSQIFLGGNITSASAFGGPTFSPVGGQDGVVVKLLSNGNYRGSQSISSAGVDQVYAGAFDSSGNIYVTGFYGASVSLGGATLAPGSGSTRDVLLTSYSP